VGRPLLGQWVFDVQCLLDWMALQPGYDRGRFGVVGLGQAGVVALCAAALFEDRIASAAAVDAPATYVTEQAYAAGTRMGLLAPGILRVGDVPHLAALSAPRRLIVAGGVDPQGQKLTAKRLQEAYAFTSAVYRLHKKENLLAVTEEGQAADLALRLSS
jgi:pimeloyl-ACP methyl ester carboxylesterase